MTRLWYWRIEMSTLTIRMPDDRSRELKVLLTIVERLALNKLMDELATIALTDGTGEVRSTVL